MPHDWYIDQANRLIEIVGHNEQKEMVGIIRNNIECFTITGTTTYDEHGQEQNTKEPIHLAHRLNNHNGQENWIKNNFQFRKATQQDNPLS